MPAWNDLRAGGVLIDGDAGGGHFWHQLGYKAISVGETGECLKKYTQPTLARALGKCGRFVDPKTEQSSGLHIVRNPECDIGVVNNEGQMGIA